VNDAGLAATPPEEVVESSRRHDDLILVTTPSMRARRHPRALLGLWAWETLLALLVAWPASSLVGAAYGGAPAGDAPLWAPGGHALADMLWHEVHGVHGVLRGAELVLLAGAVAGLVPMAALMIATAYATRDRRAAGLAQSLGGALRAFPSLMLLLVITGLAQALVVGCGALLGGALEGWAHGGMGEARAQQIEGVVLLLFIAAASAIGVVHDLARAAVVRFKVKSLRALALGMRTFRLAPVSLWWSWAWRATASVAPIAMAAGAAGRLGGRGGFALVFLALLHQCVVLARVALRASWLAKALRSVDGALRRVR
jgi:hypothetical protein